MEIENKLVPSTEQKIPSRPCVSRASMLQDLPYGTEAILVIRYILILVIHPNCIGQGVTGQQFSAFFFLSHVCPGSSDPPEQKIHIFASENEVYIIYYNITIL